MGILILEGADGSGKTETAKWILSQDWGFPVVYKHNTFSYFSLIASEMAAALTKPDRLHVWDRSFLSEIMYAPLFGRWPTIDPYRAESKLGDVLDDAGVRIILPAVYQWTDKLENDLMLKVMAEHLERPPASVYRMLSYKYRRASIYTNRYKRPVQWHPDRLRFSDSYESTFVTTSVQVAMHRGRSYVDKFNKTRFSLTREGESWLQTPK